MVTFQIGIVQFLSPVVTFAILLVKKFLPVVSLENRDLGSGPRFPVADPGVRYRGPLRSPILTVQALSFNEESKFLVQTFHTQFLKWSMFEASEALQ